MIVNIQIDLLFGFYTEESWMGVIAIDESSTLEDLHYAIQNAVDFDNDHMYEFYISRTPTSREKLRIDLDDERLYSLPLEDIFPLPEKRKLFYLFDYGDSWLFQVKKCRNKPYEPDKTQKYPMLVKEQGTKPEQYPNYDDDFE